MTSTNNTKTVTKETVASINLVKVEKQRLEILVVGTAPLIMHAWDPKTKQQMLDAQMAGATKTRKKKEPKDPIASYEACRYRLPDGSDGAPATAFKLAIVRAARLFEGVKMTELRAALHVVGTGPDQLVRLEAETPRMREDMVRVGMGTADIRHRPEYWPWAARLEIVFLPTMISTESVVALVDAAGLGGIGEWRPEKSGGNYGTFEVAV